MERAVWCSAVFCYCWMLLLFSLLFGLHFVWFGREKEGEWALLLLLGFFWIYNSSDCSDLFSFQSKCLHGHSVHTWLFFSKLVTYLKIAFLLLSCSGVRQQHGGKSIPWIHLLIPLGTTWGTLTLTTRRGEGCSHRVGQPASQNRRERRGQTLWCF